MSTTGQVLPTVSQEEIQRRIAEYRRQGFERQAMPHGVYQDPFVLYIVS
ncbi:MAG: hypothetical protein HY000_02650 [Planctomycetes bacterium]|nr:hypothetical protein [Planctomycetota bacterium]